MFPPSATPVVVTTEVTLIATIRTASPQPYSLCKHNQLPSSTQVMSKKPMNPRTTKARVPFSPRPKKRRHILFAFIDHQREHWYRYAHSQRDQKSTQDETDKPQYRKGHK